MSFLTKKILFPLAIFTFLFSFANKNQIEEQEKNLETSPCLQIEESDSYAHDNDDYIEDNDSHYFSENFFSGYNTSGRIETNKSWDTFVEVSYLYWQAKESGLELALKYSNNNLNINTIDQKFDYKSGFTISANTNFDHDNWDVLLKYTRLHLKNKKSLSASANEYFIPLKVYFENVNASIETNNHTNYLNDIWHIKYDVIDCLFGRPNYLGTHLIFRPKLGATGGWIDQYDDAYATFTNVRIGQVDDITVASSTKQNSWLLGPKAELNLTWLLKDGFKLLTNFSGAIVYQKFSTVFVQQDFNNLDLYSHNRKIKLGYLTSNYDLSIGFSYGKYFADNKWHFQLSAIYNYLIYLGQNKIREIIDLSLKNIKTKPSNLYINGLSVSARLDF